MTKLATNKSCYYWKRSFWYFSKSAATGLVRRTFINYRC